MPMPRPDLETFEVRRIARHEMRLRLAWTIMEYLEGVCVANLPQNMEREANLLATSLPAARLREVIRDICGFREYLDFKAYFGIDFAVIEDYADRGDVSAIEGWVLTWHGEDGSVEICRYEVDAHSHFKTDEKAASCVLWRATHGSEFHDDVAGAVHADQYRSLGIAPWSRSSRRFPSPYDEGVGVSAVRALEAASNSPEIGTAARKGMQPCQTKR